MPPFDPTLNVQLYIHANVNGIYCKNVSYDGKMFVLSNTCAFDSICQILAIAITNNLQYKTEIVSNMNVPIINTALILIEKGLKTEFYTERAKLL